MSWIANVAGDETPRCMYVAYQDAICTAKRNANGFRKFPCETCPAPSAVGNRPGESPDDK
jgi:hypothetical protein